MATKKQSEFDVILEQGVAQIGGGISAMFHSPIKIAMFVVCLLVCRYVTVHREAIYPEKPILLVLVWIIPFFLLMGFSASAPKGWDEKFDEISFKNRKGNFPKLISMKKVKNPKGVVKEAIFQSPGIPIEVWKGSVNELQSAFDATIVSISRHEGSMQKIMVKYIDDRVIPSYVEWKPDLLRKKDFELIAGEGLVDDVIFDLNKYPHALVAGQTGSGKSVTLSCLLWQCVVKGAKLFIVDFKGGIEFQRWEEIGIATVVSNEEMAIEVMAHLQEEMRQRLELFAKDHVKNIREYNDKHPEAPLCRIILGCDEVAEMLDMDGLSKDEKKDKESISQAMASLARLSRAAGINMLLGMQRPDAKVLKGQIKNNTPIRISGAFPDAVASEIVLGNPKAAQLDNIAGRMLYNLGAQTHEFQSYWFDDKKWVMPGDYQIGDVLNKAPIGNTQMNPIQDNEFTEFNIPQAEMAEWDWTDMEF